jgi:hypothetical protein
LITGLPAQRKESECEVSELSRADLCIGKPRLVSRLDFLKYMYNNKKIYFESEKYNLKLYVCLHLIEKLYLSYLIFENLIPTHIMCRDLLKRLDPSLRTLNATNPGMP